MGNSKQFWSRLFKHFVLSNFAKFVVRWSGCLKPLSGLVHSYHDLHVLCIHALLVVDRVSNSVLCQLTGISCHSWNMNIPLRHIIVSKLTIPCSSHVTLSTKQGHSQQGFWYDASCTEWPYRTTYFLSEFGKSELLF